MNFKQTYLVHYDPGHGWLEVPASELLWAGFVPSQYSYISKDAASAYLEIDCDAPGFLKARERFDSGVAFAFTNHDRDCFIRNLRPYDADAWYARRASWEDDKHDADENNEAFRKTPME